MRCAALRSSFALVLLALVACDAPAFVHRESAPASQATAQTRAVPVVTGAPDAGVKADAALSDGASAGAPDTLRDSHGFAPELLAAKTSANGKVTIEGVASQEFHTHGGPPAQLGHARFAVENRSDGPLELQVLGVEYLRLHGCGSTQVAPTVA